MTLMAIVIRFHRGAIVLAFIVPDVWLCDPSHAKCC